MATSTTPSRAYTTRVCPNHGRQLFVWRQDLINVGVARGLRHYFERWRCAICGAAGELPDFAQPTNAVFALPAGRAARKAHP